MKNMEISNVKGRIFDIQKYSVHDGPGIRTIVFLKGCALRCKWCCNPESQSFDIQNMNTPNGSKLIGRDVTAGEVIEEVKKDYAFFRRSGGGLTLSGGEMLLQPDFALALLKLAKKSGITTAVESTGYASFETIEKLLPYIDTYLLDIKHFDSDKHKAATGKDNVLILEDAVKIANEIAPEHLEICVDNPFDYLDLIDNAGSIFMGKNCPEALGDYYAGPNHTLPTSGTAKFSSPLSVDDFVKKTQYTYYTKEALEKIKDDVAYFAESEGLGAHAKSTTIRFEKE
jgi:pyruvate-formate lyase-activating enzyme